MTRIENRQEILTITMKPVAFTKCQIGQDWYKNELEIVFWPDRCYPDYMEVEAWIMENIDGHELNIEDVVEKVYNFLDSEYKPKSLSIVDNVKGNKVHFDVIVEK